MSSKDAIALICIPIEELEDHPVRELLWHADVIFGIDKDTEEAATFFGKDVLEESRRNGTLDRLLVVGIKLDPTTDDRERLGTTVFHLKGSTCFLDMDEVIRGRLAEREAPLSQVKPGEILHPPFPAEVREKIALICEAVQDVHPLTVEQWEDMFRREMHPDREIGMWLHLCECYRNCTSGQLLSADQKRDILDVIIYTCLNGSEVVGETFPCLNLSRERVREIATFVERTCRGGNA